MEQIKTLHFHMRPRGIDVYFLGKDNNVPASIKSNSHNRECGFEFISTYCHAGAFFPKIHHQATNLWPM